MLELAIRPVTGGPVGPSAHPGAPDRAVGVGGLVQSFDEAFPALYRCAYRAAYKMLGERVEAEDIAQESLARALDRWKKVAPYAQPWVSRVAANLAIDRARSHDRSRRAFTEHDPGRHDPDGVQHVDLVRALRRLSRRQRDVVVLRYLLDQPEDQVAASLGLSPGSVKTHAARGLSALRRDLEDPVGA